MGSAMEIQNGKNTDYMEALSGYICILLKYLPNIITISGQLAQANKCFFIAG